MKKGKLLIISGFSGVGKGTVVKALLSKYDDCVVSVSATTREPREGEQDGIHYFFIKKEEFEQLIQQNKLLEYAQYVDNYYGTPVDFVNDKIQSGTNVILEIEMQGALKVKEKVPEAKLIFILPPTAVTLRDRLVGRGTENAEVIQKRLIRAGEETEFIDNYEYHVINDDLDKCVQDIRDIIDDNYKAEPEKSFLQNIKKDIIVFSKGE